MRRSRRASASEGDAIPAVLLERAVATLAVWAWAHRLVYGVDGGRAMRGAGTLLGTRKTLTCGGRRVLVLGDPRCVRWCGPRRPRTTERPAAQCLAVAR